MTTKKTKQKEKKSPKSTAKSTPAKIPVNVEPKHVETDWNAWHKPMMECIRAVNMNEILYLAEKHSICYNGLERARLTASSLLSDIISICEKLVELHLNNWRFHDDRPLEDVNIFRDDAGTLVAELDFASYEEVPDGVMLDPRLEIMLYTTGEDGPWFQISFQLASQTF